MAFSRNKKKLAAFRKEKKGGRLGIFMAMFIFIAFIGMFGSKRSSHRSRPASRTLSNSKPTRIPRSMPNR